MTSAHTARRPLWFRPKPTRLGIWLAIVAVITLLLGGSAVLAQDIDVRASIGVALVPPAAPVLGRGEQEAFLRSARILRSRPAPKGVTDSRRVTLSDGVLTHDAHVQAVDESRQEFRGRTYVELNFRDSWRFNVAAYRLSLLVGLDMVPVSVERNYMGRAAAFTWWVDDVAMDEGARVKGNVRPPDSETWSQQMALVRMFDQLIYNTDRNLGNLLITSGWRVWMIDHTRAFRRHRTLRPGAALRTCDGQVIARLEALDKPTLVRELSDYLDDDEIRALLVRRDRILESFRAVVMPERSSGSRATTYPAAVLRNPLSLVAQDASPGGMWCTRGARRETENLAPTDDRDSPTGANRPRGGRPASRTDKPWQWGTGHIPMAERRVHGTCKCN